MSAQELPEIITPATTTEPVAELGPQMLTVASVSRDGTRMLLVDAAGNEFSVALATPPAPAAPAASGESRRSEKPMNHESSLRPREIQNRIRSGESPEAVADAAGVPVEKIMPFAAPVMAEREHIAERAQKASVRRPAGEPGARVLGDAVSAKLSTLDLDPELVTWDSWRRNDGRWTLVGDYATPERTGTAHLTFDPPGNFVSLDDDDARWLVGDLLPEPAAPAGSAADDLAEARERRLSAVPEPTIDLFEAAEQPVEAYLEPQLPAPAVETPAVEEPAVETPSAEEPAPVVEAPEQEQPARRTSRKKGRASVPSWDEIMFGGGSGD